MKRKVVGIHACREVIKVRPKSISEMILRKDYLNSPELKEFADWAKSKNIRFLPKDLGFLDKIASSHQGVCFTVDESPELDWESLKKPGKHLIIALDQITDPHNVGAILRTSWLMGATALLIPENRSSGLTPSSCKVASGGAEHVAVEEVTNLATQLGHLKDLDFWIYGLDGDSKKSLWSLDLPDKVVWVIGSEEKGMRIPVSRACDDIVSIPVKSVGASFNASVAAAMAISETVRQWEKP